MLLFKRGREGKYNADDLRLFLDDAFKATLVTPWNLQQYDFKRLLAKKAALIAMFSSFWKSSQELWEVLMNYSSLPFEASTVPLQKLCKFLYQTSDKEKTWNTSRGKSLLSRAGCLLKRECQPACSHCTVLFHWVKAEKGFFLTTSKTF